MVSRRAPESRRSGQNAWLITFPLAIFAVICLAFFWVSEPHWYEHWLGGLVALAGICVAYIGVFNVVIRRSTYSIILTEIPFVLALYYLPHAMVTLAMVAAVVITQLARSAVVMPSKMWFNVAKGAASISAASRGASCSPRCWSTPSSTCSASPA